MNAFAYPYVLLLLLLLPAYGFVYLRRRPKRYTELVLASMNSSIARPTWRVWVRRLLPVLRIVALLFLILALARPQSVTEEDNIKAQGIDIVLAIDLSSSMLAQDFKPDRLTAARSVATDFINKRAYDRIGLVTFAGEAFTSCPVTTDHEVLRSFIAALSCGQLTDGTAIGMGLATAVNRLKSSTAKSKIIILMTDGVNNAGYIKPPEAAALARKLGIKVYTIGVGSVGEAYAPIGRTPTGEYLFSFTPVEIDERLMTDIATETGGRYFRAKDERDLASVYTEIDRLEKTDLDVSSLRHARDDFRAYLLPAICLLLLEVILRFTVGRSLP